MAGVVRLQRQPAAHVRQARRRHREARDAEPDEHEREQRVARGLAADADRPRQRAPRLHGRGHQAQERRLPGVEQVGELAGEAVGGERVLREVVRADAREARRGEDLLRAERGGGHLNHGDEFARRGVSAPVAL